MARSQGLNTLAVAALRASVQTSAEIISVMDLIGDRFPLSALNRTATITNLRARLDTVQRFIDALEGGEAPE